MTVRFIKPVNLAALRNNLHFEFLESIRALLQTRGSDVDCIAEPMTRLTALLADEDAAMDQIRKYDATDRIHAEDHRRDNIFYGMREAIRTGLRHFDTAKCEAALRLDTVFENFKKAPKMPLPEESAAIYNLLQELEKRRDDINLLGLADWIAELRQANDEVRGLMAQRESEAAARTQLRMKEVRAEADRAYAGIVARLEASAVLQGPERYMPLFNEINARTDEYQAIAAREKGLRNKKKENKEGAVN